MPATYAPAAATNLETECSRFGGGYSMLWILFAILLIAWLLGLIGTYQIGAFVWLLLVAALVVLVIQLVTGRRPVV